MAQHYTRARLLLGLLGVDAFDQPLPTVLPPEAVRDPLGDGSDQLGAPGRHEASPPLTGRNVYLVVGESDGNWRRWEDWVKYGFATGGLTSRIGKAMDKIKKGDRIFAYLSGHGYVGVGIAMADAAPVDRAQAWDSAGTLAGILTLPFAKGRAPELALNDPALVERAVRVRWLQTATRAAGFFERDIFHSPQTTCTLLDRSTIDRVLRHFGLFAST